MRFHNSSGIEYTHKLKTDGRTIRSSKELVVSAWSIPADQAGAYKEAVGKLHQNVLNLWARERFGRIRPPGAGISMGGIVWWIYVIAMIGALATGVLHTAAPFSQRANPPPASPPWPAPSQWPRPPGWTGPMPQWPPAPTQPSRP
jgi:hypothetical protein